MTPLSDVPPWNVVMIFGTEKTRILGLPGGKKFENMFNRFDTIHKCDIQTDGNNVHCITVQATLCMASHGNKIDCREVDILLVNALR